MTSEPDSEPEAVFLGKYRLLARLGTGGMAEVLLARFDGPAGFTKHFAIKRMRPELTTHREFVDLFLEEARTAALLGHPNVCQVNELVVEGHDYFMVLEYLEGIALSSVLIRSMSSPGSVSVPFLVGVMQQACEGLHYAHDVADEHGVPYDIVHRDISPPNLFVTVGGVVKVLDFGISKSRDSVVKTMTGQIRGKFAYMSPEQLRGEKLDRRSDVFSLAIVMFELVTGRRLFRRKTRLDVFKAIVREPIPTALEVRPDLPPKLSVVLEHALARDRGERFDNARAFGEAMVDATRDVGIPTPAKGIGAFVRQEFQAELASRRQLLSDPPALQLASPPPPGIGAAALATQPTARHVLHAHTIPDGAQEQLDDTSLDTSIWSRAEVTTVDLRAGEDGVIEDELLRSPDEPDGDPEP